MLESSTMISLLAFVGGYACGSVVTAALAFRRHRRLESTCTDTTEPALAHSGAPAGRDTQMQDPVALQATNQHWDTLVPCAQRFPPSANSPVWSSDQQERDPIH